MLLCDRNRRYRPGKLEVWLLGQTCVIGGQYFVWNTGLTAGVVSFLIAILIFSAAYFTFCCCLAEITGVLPFAGGAYGIARCSLGFFPAFLIGCAEALQYIACVATSIIALAEMVKQMVPAFDGMEPLIWLFFYMTSIGIQTLGGNVFWATSNVIGLASLLILVLYCCGGLQFVDMPKSLLFDKSVHFIDGMRGFMTAFPFASCFHMGVEVLNLASDDVESPSQTIPRAQLSCITATIITGIATFVVATLIPSGDDIHGLAETIAPLDRGFSKMLRSTSRNVTLLSLPATFGVAFGFMWASSKLIKSMATSKLLPSWLGRTSKKFNTPYPAQIAGAMVGYGLCLVVYFFPVLYQYVFPLTALLGFLSYVGQCVGYILLHRNFPLIEKSAFRNPFGLTGVVFSTIVWLVGIVGILGFQEQTGILGAVVGMLTVLLGAYYYGYARSRQRFSEEENRVLLAAHVMKFNLKGGRSRSSRTWTSSRAKTQRYSHSGPQKQQQQQPPTILGGTNRVAPQGPTSNALARPREPTKSVEYASIMPTH